MACKEIMGRQKIYLSPERFINSCSYWNRHGYLWSGIGCEAHIREGLQHDRSEFRSLWRSTEFATDHADEELSVLKEFCTAQGAEFAISEVFAHGGDGGIELAKKVVASCEKPQKFQYLYGLGRSD